MMALRSTRRLLRLMLEGGDRDMLCRAAFKSSQLSSSSRRQDCTAARLANLYPATCLAVFPSHRSLWARPSGTRSARTQVGLLLRPDGR